MKISKILLCIFLSLGIKVSYSIEFDEKLFDFENEHFSHQDVENYLAGQPGSFADIFNSMDDGTGLDNSTFQQINSDDDQMSVDVAEVQKIASWLRGEQMSGAAKDVLNSSPLSSPDVIARPSVTGEQINSAIEKTVDSQPITYDKLKWYAVSNCVFCKKGFGE